MSVIGETLDSVADKLLTRSLNLPVVVTVKESVPCQNCHCPLAAGSILWIFSLRCREVAHFKDEFGHEIDESASYNHRSFELLSDQPELDDVEFKTLRDALAHTPQPKQLYCRSSWKENSAAKEPASLDVNDMIKVLETSEHVLDGHLYHKVQRHRDFSDHGDPIYVPAEEEIIFSTSFSGKHGLLLPDIIALKKHNALGFPLRLRPLHREGKRPKYKLCDLGVERSFVVRVSNGDENFDTMRLPVGKTPLTVRVHAHGSALLKLISSPLTRDDQLEIDNLPQLGPPTPGGFSCHQKATSIKTPLHGCQAVLQDGTNSQDWSRTPQRQQWDISLVHSGDECEAAYQNIDAVVPHLPLPARVEEMATQHYITTGVPSSPSKDQTGSAEEGIYDSVSENESPYATIGVGNASESASLMVTEGYQHYQVQGLCHSPLQERRAFASSNRKIDRRNQTGENSSESSSDDEDSGYAKVNRRKTAQAASLMEVSTSLEAQVFRRSLICGDARFCKVDDPYNKMNFNQSVGAHGDESAELYTLMSPGHGILQGQDKVRSSTSDSNGSVPRTPPKIAYYWKWKYGQLMQELESAEHELAQQQRYSSISSHSSSSEGCVGSEATSDKSYQELVDRLEKSKAARQAAELQIDEMVQLLFSACNVCGIKFD